MLNKNIESFFTNGRKIMGVQIIDVSSKVEKEDHYITLKSQLYQYVDEDLNKEYCLDLSNLKINCISQVISTMMSFQRYCFNKNKDACFRVSEELKEILESAQLEGEFDISPGD